MIELEHTNDNHPLNYNQLTKTFSISSLDVPNFNQDRFEDPIQITLQTSGNSKIFYFSHIEKNSKTLTYVYKSELTNWGHFLLCVNLG